MRSFTRLSSTVLPMDRANVDTDAIIPKQYLKSVRRTGFGVNLFDDWRYLDAGEPDGDHSRRRPNPDFVLNQPRYRDAQILLARENFGCGSSREHAVWALDDFGIRAIIAPSFADIFFNNCLKNGLLPIVLHSGMVDQLFAAAKAATGYSLSIDLKTQTVSLPTGEQVRFDIDAFRKHSLLHGLDEIGLTLSHSDEIHDYEERRRREAPWLFQHT
jgi:3-isopropylmalate/(R)-2-methylmalate dehydratase small subunit